MKQLVALIFIIIVIFISKLEMNAQPINWMREYPQQLENVYGTCITQTFDGGYVMCGQTKFNSDSIFVLRTNNSGGTLWSKQYPGIYPSKIIQTNDSNLIIVGNVESPSGFSTVAYILKINIYGEFVWSKKYQLTLQDAITDVKEFRNNNLFFYGSAIFSYFPLITKYFLLKTNFIGDSIWVNYYDSTNGSGLMTIFNENRILLTGAKSSSSKAIVTDTNGNLVKSSNANIGQGIGDYIEKKFFFIKDTITSSYRSINFMKTDTNFNMITLKTITIPMRNLYSADLLKHNSQILIGGGSSDVSQNTPIGFLLETDNDGNVIWYKDYLFGENRYLEFNSLNRCIDRGFITVGYVGFLNDGGSVNILATKTDSMGKTTIVSANNNSTSIAENFILYQNFPNPFNSQTTIKFELYKDSKVKLYIHNSLGQEIEIFVNESLSSGTYNFSYKANENLSSGIYFYSLQIQNSFYNILLTKKLLLLK